MVRTWNYENCAPILAQLPCHQEGILWFQGWSARCIERLSHLCSSLAWSGYERKEITPWWIHPCAHVCIQTYISTSRVFSHIHTKVYSAHTHIHTYERIYARTYTHRHYTYTYIPGHFFFAAQCVILVSDSLPLKGIAWAQPVGVTLEVHFQGHSRSFFHFCVCIYLSTNPFTCLFADFISLHMSMKNSTHCLGISIITVLCSIFILFYPAAYFPILVNG